jgi:uncharacterized protein YdeI (YjbR/CyaY-like superfamily)
MNVGKTLYLRDAKSWRSWLARNHAKRSEIWLVFHRKSSGKPRISYNDAVDAALCYGWIDSTVKSLDEERFAQRFCPRKPTSSLSPMNRERVRKLIASHRMTRAGLAAISHVFDPAGDKPAAVAIPPDILGPLQANKAAWTNFQQMPEAYKRIRIAYIESRKRHGRMQFLRSLAYFIKVTEAGKRIGFVKE